jgi:transcriptional regulator with XRE-family HTH domain
MTISEAIRTARENKGYSRNKLAMKAGINQQSISNWELGLSFPNIINLIPIADALNISLDELVGRELNKIQKKGNSRNASSM